MQISVETARLSGAKLRKILAESLMARDESWAGRPCHLDEKPMPREDEKDDQSLTYIELLCMMLLCRVREREFIEAARRASRDTMEFNKDLIAASSTPLVLAILADGDSYGYAILTRVRDLSGGRMEWTDGMLYPVLHRLERLGYVKARWEIAESGRRRKYYQITSRGRAQLAEERRQWQAVDATLRGIWSALRLPISDQHPVFAEQFPNGA